VPSASASPSVCSPGGDRAQDRLWRADEIIGMCAGPAEKSPNRGRDLLRVCCSWASPSRQQAARALTEPHSLFHPRLRPVAHRPLAPALSPE
jgi:hypothetical protein